MSKTILVADDNAAGRELMREILESSGYEVVEAADGEEALKEARRQRPDLMLVDIQMPRLDGYGVVRAVRLDEHLAGLPVIALTALAMQGDRERALDAGFDGYISKPVDLATLRQEVRRLL